MANDDSSITPATPTTGRLTRRTALKGAGLAAGALWVAPLIQVVSMDSAAAASAPPTSTQPGGGTTTPSNPRPPWWPSWLPWPI